MMHGHKSLKFGAAMSRNVLSRPPGKTRRRCPKFDSRCAGEPTRRVSRGTVQEFRMYCCKRFIITAHMKARYVRGVAVI